MKIQILGLGWYGLPLAESLLKQGHLVSGSVSSDEKVFDLKKKKLNLSVVKLKFPERPQRIDADILILNIPPFEGELDWFKSWDISTETWIIFISSTSVLSKSDDKLKLQEEWVRSHKKWTVLRFGGLFGGNRHPGKSLSGKKNLPGRLWPVNLLHLDDAIGFTQTVIEKNLVAETFNVLTDDHPGREDFYSSYCRDQNIPVPEFDPGDVSQKRPIDNSLARKFYSFTRLK